ncbi:MAG TPA: galactokinase [Bryobacteraceae bacterium]|nr:galactokinase [Bryobacteraceae bacterium]
MTAELWSSFSNGERARVFRAPGRVNLIGEHTDYNLGFVLPVALDLAATITVTPSVDGKLRIYSEQHDELREWNPADIGQAERAGHWSDYSIGVARELLRTGYQIEAANLWIRSSVPEGSGLSSSAALEVSSALAFLRGRPIDPIELARLCQRAEVEFVGMPCGIMDQYISIFGRENTAVEIDCRDLHHRYVDLPRDVAFLAVNSMVKHSLAGSAYRQRVEECAAAVEIIRRFAPYVESLRDVTPELLAQAWSSLPDIPARRARHVVSEDARVEAFVAASAASDCSAMGRLFVESHRSMQHDYEISCPEIDFLVDRAISIEGVYGARMTGGGFGGCTVNMMQPDAVEGFREKISKTYEREYQVTPVLIEVNPSRGAGEDSPK